MKKIHFIAILTISIACWASENNWTETGGATSMAGETSGDEAGYSVAMSSDGTMVAFGQPGWTGGSYNGRVLTYVLQNGTWTQTGGATSMTGENGDDNAGYSVAISADGSTVAVGEPYWDGIANDSGRVRTYRILNGVWTQTGGATSMTGENGDDNAGWAVAINADGTMVAVGEPFWSGAATDSGRVRTYILQNGLWTQTGGATSMTGQNDGDNAGYSVAISADGNTVAVGEPFWDSSGTPSGRVRTYTLQNGIWTETGGATSITGQNLNDQAGYSISMNSDGTMMAVGEPGWDGVGSNSGRVRAYTLVNGAWIETGGATSMTGQNLNDQAGYSVAMSADGLTIAVGELGWNGAGVSSGRVRAYTLENGVWTEKGSSTAMTGVVAGDQAGHSVTINSNGTMIAVGEPGWDGAGVSSGRVRAYQYPVDSGVTVNFAVNEYYIRNHDLAQVSYSDISQGTSPGHATQPSGIGQGAVFTAYRIMVQGK